MSTQLRGLFGAAADSQTPDDLAERAVTNARRCRQQRYAVGGSVVVAAAVVLGVVVASGQVRTAAAPRPNEVAGLPDALPAPGDVANLEPGMVDAASVAYLADSFLVVVDASSGEASRLTFGPPPVGGLVEDIALALTDVALSPDGRRALVTVGRWNGSPPTLRMVDLASAQETVIPDLVPFEDADEVTVERPSVAAWANDSASFTCTCAVQEGEAPALFDVLLDEQDPTDITVQASPIARPPAAGQVVIGTAGLAVQLNVPNYSGNGALPNPDGSWVLPDGSTEGGATLPAADAVALGRGDESTYLALRGGGFTIGVVSTNFIKPATVTAEGDLTYSSTVGGGVSIVDVDAVRDGFVVVTTKTLAREGGGPMIDPQVVSIATDGTQRPLTTLPSRVTTASFAANLVQIPSEPAPDQKEQTSLPAELPAPNGLPELAAGTMDAASAAYVVDDQLVLMGADSADGAVWRGIPYEDLTVGLVGPQMEDGALRPFQVRLSPDGTTALVAMRFETSQRLLGIRLAVLDVASAESSVEDLNLTDAYTESTWLEYNVIAWAPDSKTAYCVCIRAGGINDAVSTWSLSVGKAPIDTFYSQVSDFAPAQISAGTAGLIAQLEPGGEWSRLGENGEATASEVVGVAVQAVLSHSSEPMVAGVSEDRYGIEPVDRFPMRIGWQRLPAGPVSSVQALGSDFVLVSRPLDAPSGEPAPPSPLLAHLLTQDAAPLPITTFPSGTRSTSFAADVDAIG